MIAKPHDLCLSESKRVLFGDDDASFLGAVAKEFLCRRRRRRAKVKLDAEDIGLR